MRSSAPHAVGDILPTAVPQLLPRLIEQAVRRQWGALVGPELARRAQPGALSGDCLRVIVDNSPWLHELTLRAPQIVASIDRALGPGRVRSLRITFGRLEADQEPPVRPPAERVRRATETERRAIDQAVAPVADPALAASLRRLFLKSGRFS